ncbi:MAG: 2-hydroxyacid dehydrogenase [Pseudomonadota bacterium]
MRRPVVLQVGPYPEWDQEPLDGAFDVRKLFLANDTAAFLETHGQDVEAIATRGELGADATMIAACPSCKLISVYGVGYDAVDLNAAQAQNIRVTNTPDVLTGDVADLGVAMMLALSRGMVGAEKWVRDGSWVEKGLYPLKRRVFGRKAGILGLGRIGYEVGKRLAGFGMDIAYSDLSPRDDTPDWTYLASARDLAQHAEFLFVTLAASAKTRGIVNREIIEAVGPDGMIINVSRASNINEVALIDALSSGRLGAAALDVFEGEPALDPRFFDLDNVLLQPHHASGTVETRKAMGQLLRDNLTAHFSGAPLLSPVL